MTMPARAGARAHRLAAPAVLAVVGLVVAIGVVLALPAHAAAYRFWSYWQSPGGVWTFSQAGPGAVLPADGSVEGWRFGITTEAASADDGPRVGPSFDALCGSTPARAGMKRVGLVIDFGEPSHAPDGETPPATVAMCAVVPDDANGYAVLGVAAPSRTEAGLVCGIDGFPAHECAAVIDDAVAAAATASPTTDVASGSETVMPSSDAAAQDSPSSIGIVISVIVVVFVIVLGGAAVRRRST